MEHVPPAVDGNKGQDIGKILRDDTVQIKAVPDLLIESAFRAGDEFQDGPRRGHLAMGRVRERLVDVPVVILPRPGNDRPHPLRLNPSAQERRQHRQKAERDGRKPPQCSSWARHISFIASFV